MITVVPLWGEVASEEISDHQILLREHTPDPSNTCVLTHSHKSMAPQSQMSSTTVMKELNLQYLQFSRASISFQLTSILPVTCFVVVLWPELWLQWQ